MSLSTYAGSFSIVLLKCRARSLINKYSPQIAGFASYCCAIFSSSSNLRLIFVDSLIYFHFISAYSASFRSHFCFQAGQITILHQPRALTSYFSYLRRSTEVLGRSHSRYARVFAGPRVTGRCYFFKDRCFRVWWAWSDPSGPAHHPLRL